MKTPRDQLYDFLRSEVVGPLINAEGDTLDEISSSPTEQFSAGLVFPQGTPLPDEINTDSSVVPEESAGSELGPSDIAVESGRFFPSAVGITFIVNEPCVLSLKLQWARYRREGRNWKRTPHSMSKDLKVSGEAFSRESVAVAEGVNLSILTRRVAGGIAITASLVNAIRYQDLADQTQGQPPRSAITANALYEVALHIAPSATLSVQQGGALLGASDEDQELAFQYRSVSTYAVGHGIAACWDVEKNSVWTDAVPSVLVPGLTFTSPDHEDLKRGLSLEYLAQSKAPLEPLDQIASDYEKWTASQAAIVATESLSPAQTLAAQKILDKQRLGLDRIRKGISVLRGNAIALKSFQLANLILLRQMNRNPEKKSTTEASWRLFQISFALVVIGDLDEDRTGSHCADLLWFPTGGGKTEAYLFLVAYEMVYRRLSAAGLDDGVVALSRYSLRLLTSQQFQRAAALMVAAELIRKEKPELGNKPFEVGLHVGQDASPKDIEAVEKKFAPAWRSGDSELPIPYCVWCAQRYSVFANELDPRNSFFVGQDDVTIMCRNSACEIVGIKLPVQFLQARVRRTRPTMVIATLDSFASLPCWSEDEVGMLGSASAPAPSLVIQDELHLLTGPLGTADALYEAALDALMSVGGKKPKIIASTATIKHASAQSRLLYGREISVFPPAGVTPQDNYFSAATTSERDSRLYVGVMSVGASWQTTAVRTMSTLAQGPTRLPVEARDPYWTQVLYVSTTRTHGRVTGLLRDDVKARVTSRYGPAARQLPENTIVELMGSNDASQLVTTLERLQTRYPDRDTISALVTTSVIQVGVDIPRLGLISFVGQPYSNSEYIQASSRVGRVAAAPGLVITMFNHSKSRDRSFYECFKAYHDSLYRWVEPVSITPYSVTALERYLPAVLVAISRFGVRDSKALDPEQAISEGGSAWGAREFLLGRIEGLPQEELGQLQGTLEYLMRHWQEWALSSSSKGSATHWTSRGEGVASLVSFSNSSLWKIASSLRDVEPPVGFKPFGSGERL